MIKIQGKDITTVSERQVVIVRTFKGEIVRTNLGVVTGYPLSFLTVGVTLSITDTKENIRKLVQIILAHNIIKLECDYNSVQFYGDFSVTSHEVQDLKDKGERSAVLVIELVSHGTALTKPNGTKFTVTYGGSTVQASFAEIITLPAGWKLNGASLPNNKLLVLGDTLLEA